MIYLDLLRLASFIETFSFFLGKRQVLRNDGDSLTFLSSGGPRWNQSGSGITYPSSDSLKASLIYTGKSIDGGL